VFFKKSAFLVSCLLFLSIRTKAQDHQFDPPWNTPPQSRILFTVPGIDNVPDLYGDINDPQLVIFFAGNQFMCVDSLLTVFKRLYPKYRRVFVETLPPGVLANQIESGSITIGNMRITLKPDIYTDGKNHIDKIQGLFSKTEAYADNNLAIMVQKRNPKNVQGLKDLARADIRVSMPNPEFESIGKRIEDAYIKAGGESLQRAIMVDKVKNGSTYLTQIHHRQTPMRIMYNQSDAAPVWYSEALYQKMIGHPVDIVNIPANENVSTVYVAGLLKAAPHLQAAKDFMDFLASPAAKNIYKKYGFKVN
jgi:molybdate transport system substrate-binding protein